MAFKMKGMSFGEGTGSPKKFLGGLLGAGVGKLAMKALGNKKVRQGIGKVGGTMLQAFGGPLGGMIGKGLGGVLTKKSAYKKYKKNK